MTRSTNLLLLIIIIITIITELERHSLGNTEPVQLLVQKMRQAAVVLVGVADDASMQHHKYFFFSGVPLLECCRVDDTSPEKTIVGLPPS